MKKNFMPVSIMAMLAAVLVSAKADAVSVSEYQFQNIFWYAEDDYAVISGNIYDRNEEAVCNLELEVAEKIVIPAEIDGLPVKVFDGHFDMFSPEEVILPEGLTTIREGAFNCSPIIELTIPSTVTLIEPGAIQYCYDLKKINVDPNNQNYMMIDRLLYTKDGKELLSCLSNPEADDWTLIIPRGTDKVQSYAFSNFGCDGKPIGTLIFQEGLTTLENSAMSEALVRFVYFPSTLKYMGDYSFNSVWCEAVYFHTDLPTLGKDVFSDFDTMIFIGDNEGITAEDLNAAMKNQDTSDRNNESGQEDVTDTRGDTVNQSESDMTDEKTESGNTPSTGGNSANQVEKSTTRGNQELIALTSIVILGIALLGICLYKRNGNR